MALSAGYLSQCTDIVSLVLGQCTEYQGQCNGIVSRVLGQCNDTVSRVPRSVYKHCQLSARSVFRHCQPGTNVRVDTVSRVLGQCTAIVSLVLGRHRQPIPKVVNWCCHPVKEVSIQALLVEYRVSRSVFWVAVTRVPRSVYRYFHPQHS